MLNKVILRFLITGSLVAGAILFLQFMALGWQGTLIPEDTNMYVVEVGIIFGIFVFLTAMYVGLCDTNHGKLFIVSGSLLLPFFLIWKMIASLFVFDTKELYGDILKPFGSKKTKRKNK